MVAINFGGGPTWQLNIIYFLSCYQNMNNILLLSSFY